MAKAISQVISGVIQIAFIVITVLIGLWGYRYIKNSAAQQQQDQANAQQFASRGLFGSFGDFLLGKDFNKKINPDTSNTTSADKSGGQTNDTQALADLRQQEQDLQNQISQRDKLISQLENDAGKSTGATTTPEQNKTTADTAIQHETQNPNETFKRSSENIGIFNLQTPIDLPKPDAQGNTTLYNFAYFRTAPKTREEALRIKEEAIKQVTALGFKVPKGTAPITVLTSSPERINRYAAQLEASEQRRLGLREAGQPLTKTANVISATVQGIKDAKESTGPILRGGSAIVKALGLG